jgi:hypothetical protein
MSLDGFDSKVQRLLAWCRVFKTKENKWPTVKDVREGKLEGIRDKTLVESLLRYLREEGHNK